MAPGWWASGKLSTDGRARSPWSLNRVCSQERKLEQAPAARIWPAAPTAAWGWYPPPLAPVNPRQVNPIGFKWATDRGLAACLARSIALKREETPPAVDGGGRGLGEGGSVPGGPPGAVVAPGRVEPAGGAARRPGAARATAGFPPLHPAAAPRCPLTEHAGHIFELSAAGVPVHLWQMSAATGALLGCSLPQPWSWPPLKLSRIPARGQCRRAPRGLREHSIEAAWRRVAEYAGAAVPRPRALSVIVATNLSEPTSSALLRRSTTRAISPAKL